MDGLVQEEAYRNEHEGEPEEDEEAEEGSLSDSFLASDAESGLVDSDEAEDYGTRTGCGAQYLQRVIHGIERPTQVTGDMSALKARLQASCAAAAVSPTTIIGVNIKVEGILVLYQVGGPGAFDLRSNALKSGQADHLSFPFVSKSKIPRN